EGAIAMARAELRHGRNEPLRRLTQEIIVTQSQEIGAMKLAIGQRPEPAAAAPAVHSPAERFHDGVLHGFPSARPRGTARLVYGIDRDLRGSPASSSRRHLSHAEDGRAGARPERRVREGPLGGRVSALSRHLDRVVAGASRVARAGDRESAVLLAPDYS